jgi:hypothetical protein
MKKAFANFLAFLIIIATFLTVGFLFKICISEIFNVDYPIDDSVSIVGLLILTKIIFSIDYLKR